MFTFLLRKYASESALLLVCTSILLLMFTWVRIWTIAQFELSGFRPLIDQMRAFEKFSPVPLEQFLTYEGVIGLSFVEPILMLSMLTWSISRGSDVVSGELNRGTLEMLLAQPIKRTSIILSHATVSVLGLAILCVAAFAGIYAGIETNSTVVVEQTNGPELFGVDIPFMNGPPARHRVALSELVNIADFLPAAVNMFALGFFVLALSTAVSSFDQYRWRTIGLVIAIYILQALLFVLAKSTAKTRFLMPFSFIGAYQPDWMVHAVTHLDIGYFQLLIPTQEWWFGYVPGPGGYSLILIVLGCVCYVLSLWRFQRRDLPAPL